MASVWKPALAFLLMLILGSVLLGCWTWMLFKERWRRSCWRLALLPLLQGSN